MFNDKHPYTLRVDENDDNTNYFAIFEDGQGVLQEIEIDETVYIALARQTKKERNLCRFDERHIERLDLSEEKLRARLKHIPKSLDDFVDEQIHKDILCQAIRNLPEIQRRRFILYHFYGLTYEKIALREGCTLQAVAYTIAKSENNLRKFFTGA